MPVEHQSWSGPVTLDDQGRPCIAVNAREEPYDAAIDLGRASAEEHFVNAFAAAFLMPRRAVLAQLERVIGASGGRFTDFDLVHMAMHFGVK